MAETLLTPKLLKKAEMAMNDFHLTPSEIKKAESLATRQNGKPTRLTGYFHKGYDETGHIQVKCEMCSKDMTERENDVYIEVCTFDRRRSWAHN